MGLLLLGNKQIFIEDHFMGMMQSGHVRIHECAMYTVSYRWSALADDGTALLSGIIPAGLYPHYEFEISAGGDSYFDIYEGGTVTGGTALIAYNRNRNADVLSIATIAQHSGTLTGGTSIFQSYVPGGQKNFAVGGGARAESEWIAKDDLTTIWALVNKAGEAKDFSMEATFYLGGAD